MVAKGRNVIYMHPQDLLSIQRMLGESQTSLEIEHEYKVRLQMYHRDGNSGPLGTLGLLDMLRFLKLAPPAAEERAPEIDWREMPQDGRVRVEARFWGSWMPGVFLGFIESGTLAIRLDHDPVIRECRKDMVRFVEISDSPFELPEPPSPAAAVLEKPEPVEEQSEPGGLDEAEEYGDAGSPVKGQDVDWATLPAGTPVWVEMDDDLQDAVYVGQAGTAEAPMLRVAVGEEESEVPLSAVLYPGD